VRPLSYKTMIDSKQVQGIFAAIPTPVQRDGAVHEGATCALLDYLIRQGADGVVPLGGTGEFGSLSQRERVHMAEVTTTHVAGRMPVVAGVLTPGLRDGLDAARDFAAVGVDAVMVVTPYYTNPTQQGIRDYFMRFADESPLPVLLYEIPYRTRIAIDPTVIHELSRHERIIGMKACNPDLYHFLKTAAGIDESFSLLSGEDTLFPLHMSAGARGGVLSTATMLPKTWRRIMDLVRGGNLQEALLMHRQLMPFIDLVFAETNPGPMKSVLQAIGVDAPELLEPLLPAAAQTSARLREQFERLLKDYEYA